MAARAHGLRSRSQETRAATGKAATARKRLRPPRLLTYVDAVARHGSIRKAADALSVASSALNRQILDLETDLGTALFERLPRGVRLTAAGEVFLAYARQAISELKAVESQVEQLRGLVLCFQFRRPGKAPIPPGDMIALPLIDPPLLQARLVLATRRGRVLPVAAASFVELLKTALA
jgi:Bacterial regulatory helix-turn-helix protein, lysR family